MTPELHALATSIGAAVGGAVGAIAAIKVLMRRVAREEIVRMVRPEARVSPPPAQFEVNR